MLDVSPELYTRTKLGGVFFYLKGKFLCVFLCVYFPQISKVSEKETLVKIGTFVISEFRGDDWTCLDKITGISFWLKRQEKAFPHKIGRAHV